MEEERYEWDNQDDTFARDTQTNDLVSVFEILNEQDKRIKELELLLNADKKMKTNSIKGFEKLKQENQQLKQLAINELERLKESILKINKTEIKTLENGYSTLYIDRPEIINEIDNQIKELKGENNENSIST